MDDATVEFPCLHHKARAEWCRQQPPSLPFPNYLVDLLDPCFFIILDTYTPSMCIFTFHMDTVSCFKRFILGSTSVDKKIEWHVVEHIQ